MSDQRRNIGNGNHGNHGNQPRGAGSDHRIRPEHQQQHYPEGERAWEQQQREEHWQNYVPYEMEFGNPQFFSGSWCTF